MPELEHKHFYKIENGELSYGGGFVVPDGFTEYEEGNEPQELLDALNSFDGDALKAHRDAYIEQDVTFNGMTVTNTKQERDSLSGIVSGWLTDESVETINFKHNDGYTHATISDIKGLLKTCFLREQAGRDAEYMVLQNHDETPYADIQDALDDFDTEVGA